MNEDEKKFLKELTEIRIEFNKRVNKLMLLVAIVFCVSMVGQTIDNISNQHTIAEICKSNDAASVEAIRLYFTTDYYYPEMTQTTDVKVGE